jgi:opacity protein-like surface antigen
MIDKKLLVAALALVSVASGPASAADILGGPPPRVVPAPIEVGGGWYLRGDVGMGRQELNEVRLSPPVAGFGVVQSSQDDVSIIGLGIGYQANDWLRIDLTGEWRGASSFQFLLNQGGQNGNFNNYNGRIESIVGLINVYADIGNFWGIVPFIGAGIGFAHHNVSGFQDVGFIASGGGFGYAQEQSSTEFAWALHAGLGYVVNENLRLELSYRYLNMGDVNAGSIDCQGPFACNPRINYTLRDMSSHDIRIGMRWMLNPPQSVAAPIRPVIARN